MGPFRRARETIERSHTLPLRDVPLPVGSTVDTRESLLLRMQETLGQMLSGLSDAEWRGVSESTRRFYLDQAEALLPMVCDLVGVSRQ